MDDASSTTGSIESTKKLTMIRYSRAGFIALAATLLCAGCSNTDGDGEPSRGQEGILVEAGVSETGVSDALLSDADKGCGLLLESDPPPQMDQSRLNVLAEAEARPGDLLQMTADVSVSGYPWDGEHLPNTEEGWEEYDDLIIRLSEEALEPVLCELDRMGASNVGTLKYSPTAFFTVDSAVAVKIATEWPDRIRLYVEKPPPVIESGSCTPAVNYVGCTISDTDTFCYGLQGRVYEWFPELGCKKEVYSSQMNDDMAFECFDTGIPYVAGMGGACSLSIGCLERVVDGGIIQVYISPCDILEEYYDSVAAGGWTQCSEENRYAYNKDDCAE
ncbi:MAG: hypothetical protein FWD57_02435 [Polyangiaceae bacterium]|nr:hypothetical protein [Polyangiaceae bacterium]